MLTITPESHKTRSSALANPEAERFWRHVRRLSPNACWEWTGPRWGNGRYGRFWYLGVVTSAHRIAFALSHGPVPAGRLVRHKCDHTLCCNPAHLSAGTQLDNMRDATERGRLRVPRPTRQKVTTAQLAEVDALLASGVPRVRIAHQFGVSKGWVSLYAQGYRRQYDRPEGV